MLYDIIESPVGELTISTDGQAITSLHIEGDRYFTSVPSGWEHHPDHPILREATRQLEEYFAGRRLDFDLPLAAQGTAFQNEVWTALQSVSAGSVTSYAEIAQQIGNPKAARAVGTAVGRNPICILIPCHRVLASGGGFGGYVAGIDCKRQLLRLENAIS